ncbi:5'-methylthioadenosine/S-adenosylhomocysteine nucleosidase [Bacteroides cellulosilyticus]|jgi:adenosylhomocysteine nucleosidase|uniref:5'-methylthioadenosine/S-adenosylhomocysteine nucleosidase n=1 Tax=Bacteroides cellulosilyticus TaxID=246787 RepID=UPI0022E601B5|nr:5'-methylthioadenosine/S-adenosylhomocysteine nucleosidase [Bacteroides cellulosilyticus]
MKEKIGILCASDTELLPFLENIRPLQTIKKAMLKFHLGQIGNIQTIMVYSGVCKVNAAIAAQLLIDLFHVDAIINAGVAGGIDPNVWLFDTVISERMEQIAVEKYNVSEIHLSCFNTNTKGILLYSKLGYTPYEFEKWLSPKNESLALIKMKRSL